MRTMAFTKNLTSTKPRESLVWPQTMEKRQNQRTRVNVCHPNRVFEDYSSQRHPADLPPPPKSKKKEKEQHEEEALSPIKQQDSPILKKAGISLVARSRLYLFRPPPDTDNAQNNLWTVRTHISCNGP